MLKVAIVRGDEREIALSSRGSNPSIGCRHWPTGDAAFGHDVSPD
jgi:hypothetical protein